MYSRRPLSIEELAEAIAVKPGMDSLRQLQSKMPRRTSDIFEICGSYIRQSKLTGQLSLAHYSIFEWLSSKELPSGLRNQFFLDPHITNNSLARSCATYLCFKDYGTQDFLDKVDNCLTMQHDTPLPQISIHSPFLDYASRYWGAHLTDNEETA